MRDSPFSPMRSMPSANGADHSRALRPGRRRAPVAFGDTSPSPDGVAHPTTITSDRVPAQRIPAYFAPPGHGPDVSHPGSLARPGGDQPGFLLASPGDAAWAGAPFAAVDVRS
jgi:hypothetical protein